MQQDDAADKAYEEMSSRDLFQRVRSAEDVLITKEYLKQLYAIGFDEGRKQAKHGKPVAQYDMKGNFIKVFGSISIAARAVKRDKGSIQKAADGKSAYSGGFKWKYADNGNDKS